MTVVLIAAVFALAVLFALLIGNYLYVHDLELRITELEEEVGALCEEVDGRAQP